MIYKTNSSGDWVKASQNDLKMTAAGTKVSFFDIYDKDRVADIILIQPTPVVGIAAIAGVTVPVTGATPVTSVTATAEFTGTVTWAPADAAFSATTVYTATITIVPAVGYTLAGVPANFFTVTGATSVTHAAGSGVITAVFPATL